MGKPKDRITHRALFAVCRQWLAPEQMGQMTSRADERRAVRALKKALKLAEKRVR